MMMMTMLWELSWAAEEEAIWENGSHETAKIISTWNCSLYKSGEFLLNYCGDEGIGMNIKNKQKPSK